MNVLDLFCGVGGWSKGFAELGHDCTGVDIRDYKYPYRFIKADIHDWEPDQHYDIVVASPPCSEFCRIKRQFAEPYDERIGLDLVHRAFYLIQKIKPRYYLVENVPGLAEFLGPPAQIVRKNLAKNSKQWYLYTNMPRLGFLDSQITVKHDWFSGGHHGMAQAKRAEIPIQLSRAVAVAITKQSQIS